MTKRLALFALLSATAPIALSPAAAQPGAAADPAAPARSERSSASADGGVEEIIVTANKRQENLQDVSVAVSAVTGERLLEAHISDLKGLQTLVPTITMGDDNNVAKIYVRGVGLNTSVAGAESGVAFHVDGAVISRPEAQLSSIFDLERVEALRGPQGTLYGRNAVGGAINVITAKPTRDPSGYLDITYGNYERLDVGGAVSGPLTDTLFARLAVRSEDMGGYGENVATGQAADDVNRQMARLQLLFEPRSGFDWLLSGEWFRMAENSGIVHKGALEFPDPNSPGGSLLIPSGLGGYAQKPRDYAADFDLFTKARTWALTSTMNWDISDAFSLTNITNYRDFKKVYSYDNDISTVVNSPQVTGRSRSTGTKGIFSEQFSSEFQLKTDLSWVKGVLGLFYFDETQNGQQLFGTEGPRLGLPRSVTILQNRGIDPLLALELCGLEDYAFSPQRTDGQPNPPPNFCGVSTHKTKAYALFGQYIFDLGAASESLDGLAVKLGGRYSHERRSVDNPGLQINTSSEAVTVWLPGTRTNKKTFKDFTPEVGLEWKPTRDILLYYTYSEGFKSGVGEAITPGSTILVDPETIQNHEIGLKSSLFGDRLVLNLAAFTYDLQGMQIQKSTTAGPGLPATQRFENAAEVEAKGVELEFRAAPLRDLRLNGSIAYLDSKFVDFTTVDPLDPRNIVSPTSLITRAPPISLAGNPTRNSPKWSAGGGVEVDFRDLALPGDGYLTLRGDIFYRSKTYYSEFKRIAEGQEAYTLLDASLRYQSDTSDLSIMIWGKNLTNELVIGGGYALTSQGIFGYTYLPPRTYGISAGYKF